MLEITNHTKINTTNLKKPTKKIISSIMGVVIAINTYSGALAIKASADNSYNESSTSISQIEDEVTIPSIYRQDVAYYCCKPDNYPITKTDLANMKDLCFWLEDEAPSFLEYCTSLENVIIKTKNNNLDNLELLEKVPSLKSFSLISVNTPVELNHTNASFLTNNNIKEVRLKGHLVVEKGLLQSIPNLQNLTVVYNDHTKIDYNGLNSLKKLTIDGEAYDISITTSTDDLKKLANQGVMISIDRTTENKMLLIDSKLKKIIEGLNINENDSEQTKLNKIVLYVVEKLEYDQKMDEKIYFHDSDIDEYTDTFYEEGALYPALEMDSQICGNYAALTSALCQRLNIENYLLLSYNHSWNMVNVDGDYYYVDTTWIDKNLHLTKIDKDGKTIYENKTAEELLRSGNIGFVNNYMDEPLSYHDAAHDVLNYPTELQDGISISKEKGVYNKNQEPISENQLIEPEPVITTTTLNNAELEEQTEPIISTTIKEVTTPQIEVHTEPIETTIPVEITDVDENIEPILENIPDIKEEEYKIEVGGKEIIIGGAALISLLTALGVAKSLKKKKNKKQEPEKIENKFRI